MRKRDAVSSDKPTGSGSQSDVRDQLLRLVTQGHHQIVLSFSLHNNKHRREHFLEVCLLNRTKVLPVYIISSAAILPLRVALSVHLEEHTEYGELG